MRTVALTSGSSANEACRGGDPRDGGRPGVSRLELAASLRWGHRRTGSAIQGESNTRTRPWLSWPVAAVWIHQGLWAKILGRDARHAEIVGDVPLIGERWARAATVAIGTGEVTVALWVLSDRRPVAAATTQTLVLAGMNAGGLALSRDRIPEPRRLLVRNLGFLALVWAAAAPGRSR